MPHHIQFDSEPCPGESIREVIEALNMSQDELSIRMGLTTKTVSQLINGKAPITPNIADKLEYVTGAPGSFWLNLNCNRLGIMRNVCWQTYKGDVQAIQDALNSPGCDSETEGICRTLAGELLQRMERGSFPSSMVACARAEIAMPE